MRARAAVCDAWLSAAREVIPGRCACRGERERGRRGAQAAAARTTGARASQRLPFLPRAVRRALTCGPAAQRALRGNAALGSGGGGPAKSNAEFAALFKKKEPPPG